MFEHRDAGSCRVHTWRRHCSRCRPLAPRRAPRQTGGAGTAPRSKGWTYEQRRQGEAGVGQAARGGWDRGPAEEGKGHLSITIRQSGHADSWSGRVRTAIGCSPAAELDSRDSDEGAAAARLLHEGRARGRTKRRWRELATEVRVTRQSTQADRLPATVSPTRCVRMELDGAAIRESRSTAHQEGYPTVRSFTTRRRRSESRLCGCQSAGAERRCCCQGCCATRAVATGRGGPVRMHAGPGGKRRVNGPPDEGVIMVIAVMW